MVSDYLEVVTYFLLFFTNINFFHDFIFHESEIRTVLLEVSIDLGLLKKSLLKTSKIVLMYSNSLLRHFSSMVHAKCLLPNIDRLLLVRSCLQNFYQCTNSSSSSTTHVHKVGEGRWRPPAATALKAEQAGQARPPRVMRIHERCATRCEPRAFAYSRAPPPAAALYGLPLPATALKAATHATANGRT